MGNIAENLVDKIVLFAVFRGDTSAIGKWSRSDNHTWQWHRSNTRPNTQTNRYSAGHLDFSLPRQVWLRLRLPRPPSSWSPDRRWWPRAGSLSWRWRAPWSWHPHLPSVGALLTSVERLERVSYSLLTYIWIQKRNDGPPFKIIRNLWHSLLNRQVAMTSKNCWQGTFKTGHNIAHWTYLPK